MNCRGDSRFWLGTLVGVLVGPLALAADLTRYSDFGQADILLTAASIRQTGDLQRARIDQVTDFTDTDRAIYPIGSGNIADIVQEGAGNQAYATQTGNLNRVRIQQSGVDNYVSSSQTGVDNRLDVTQTGLSNSLVSTQNGTGNSVSLNQAGGNQAIFNETGENNSITVRQIVGGPNLNINLVGSGLTVTILQ